MPFYAQIETDLGLKLFGLEEFVATEPQSRALEKSQSALWRAQLTENQTPTRFEICDSMPLEIITLGQSRRCIDNQMDIFNEEARAITSHGWRVPSNYALYSGGGSSSPATKPRVLSPRARLSPKQASFMFGRCHSHPHREISAYDERDLQDHVPLPTAQGSDLALLDINDHIHSTSPAPLILHSGTYVYIETLYFTHPSVLLPITDVVQYILFTQ
ncbi:hypothetical protein EV421DRAFT_285015 [Armillaria borealis]|uniref:Uncharacterized protein n=1 Tax=Armillaria borealis TaxID=47425 RepID=A0AA39MTY4_9AGAR|nr:hypothetical protein EV421DRAFT_285015 [Armillaria borealis]